MNNVTVIRGKGPRPAQEQRSGIKEQLNKFNHQQPNVGMGERHISLALGGVMAGLAVGSRKPLLTGILGALSVALLHRGATGHCEVYHSMGMNTASEQDIANHSHPQHTGRIDIFGQRSEGDLVQEASEESFPASDPPSYTPTTSLGGV